MKQFKVLSILVVAMGLMGISWAVFKPKPEPPSDLFEISKNLEIFYDVYGKVEGLYVDEPSPGQLMKTGIDAMLNSLDPYTVYIPESKIEDFRFMTTGAYGGIGALIRKRGEYAMISEPYKGFPAEKAGLRAGDIIMSIDGKSIKGKTQSEISQILKGQPDTKLEVSIMRNGLTDGTPMDVTITRMKVQVPDVPYYGMVDDKTGYASLNSFTRTASKSVIEAYKALEEQGMKQFVLDLRGNGGGLLVEAVNIVNMFVPKNQEIVRMKGRLENANKVYKTRGPALNENIPVVILVDDGSASASEIVSGSLQDLDRAVIVGKRTFGKGLVQQTHDLKYNGKIKITIAKYYTPSGRCIQKLDYSHKQDNKALEVPDSLLTKFKTKSGREVMDGRGIDPDIVVTPPSISELTAVMAQENVIFDFATQYRNSHDSLRNGALYSMSNEEFEAFKAFALKQEFDYSNQSLDKLQELKKVVEDEKYMSEVEAQFEAMEKELTPNKSEDMDRYADELKTILSNEIVSRYYYQEGRIQNALQEDKFLKEAINVLNDRSKYNGLLNLP